MIFSEVSKRDARDAARLALQSAVAAAGMFSAMQMLDLPEKFIGVLSAVIVVQPSVGNTLWAGVERVVATLVGCVVGIICLILLPNGYGTAGALGFSMLVMNGIAGFRPQWRYGVVAAVALALGSEANALDTALERSVAIGAGVAFGILVSLLVWPDKASTRSAMHIRRALHAVADRLDNALQAARDPEVKTPDNSRSAYHSAIQAAREAADAVRLADNEYLLERIRGVEQLYNSVLILNRVAEETDRIAGDSEQLASMIDEVREQACEISRGLAKGNLEQQDRRRQLQSNLEAIRHRFVSARDDAGTHVLRNALVFGLNEVDESIGRLLDCYRGQSEPCADDSVQYGEAPT